MKWKIGLLGTLMVTAVSVSAIVLAAPSEQRAWLLTPLELHGGGNAPQSIVGGEDEGQISTQATLINTNPDVWLGEPDLRNTKLFLRSVSLANDRFLAIYSRDGETWQNYELPFSNVNRANRNQVGAFVDNLSNATGLYVGLARYGDNQYRLSLGIEPIPHDFWDDSGCGLACGG